MDLETVIMKLQELKEKHGNIKVLVRSGVCDNFVEIGSIYADHVVKGVRYSNMYETTDPNKQKQSIKAILFDD